MYTLLCLGHAARPMHLPLIPFGCLVGTDAARASLAVERNVVYGNDASEVYDLYLPAASTPPGAVIVYFHGGMWQFLA